MKQTAIEWLKKELETYGDPGYCKIEWEIFDELIEYAKEMEKEQIELAHIDGGKNKRTSVKYYNETFKSE
jgi:urocanate hydratase